MVSAFRASAKQITQQIALRDLHKNLEQCLLCPTMHGPPVHGPAILTPVMLIGQAPGTREIIERRPFCWTAGKTLFNWFTTLGLDETQMRQRVLISAVCRCFPGKNPQGGDRVPDAAEVAKCRVWWENELLLLRPQLILPVGKLACAQFLNARRLQEIIGYSWVYRTSAGWEVDCIPLPHPSGASTWFKMEPGRTLLTQALQCIAAHPAWQALIY